MSSSTVFTNNRSQAVRLPADARLPPHVKRVEVAELMHGAEKSSRPAANLAVVEDFCSRLEVLPYGPKAAQHHGQIRAALELVGTPIGVNDLHVAAHARSEGLVIVTNNRREFDRVPVLQVEDWSL